MAKIAVLGYGTVGSGVVEVIEKNQDVISARMGEELVVKHVLDLRDFEGDPIQEKIVHDYDVILNDNEVTIVVEVMGGIEPAYTFTKQALKAGKSVVTSNKALVAKYGDQLIALAKDMNKSYLFEASVGGGIPIIRPLKSSFSADKMESIQAILNGTTNYMMTKMFEEGAEYDEVLKEAQARGYAEKNPSADVEGHDACRKIAIIASLLSGKRAEAEEIHTEGITDITVNDMKYAHGMGMTIKLLAICNQVGDGFEAMVAPFLLSESHPLFSVNGVFNAIFLKGAMLGDAMLYGQGAGKLPTASAVVADVIAAARNPETSIMGMYSSEPLQLRPFSEGSRRFLVRLRGNKEELASLIAKKFGNVEYTSVQIDGEVGFVTPLMTEGAFEEVAKDCPQLLHRIRISE